jgi:ribonuclease H2 subunit A
MVYAVLFCPISKEKELKSLDVDDSKVLKAEEREAIFERVSNVDYVGWGLHVLSPVTISNAMLSRQADREYL